MKNKIYFRTNLDEITVPDYNLGIMPPLSARVICKARSKNVSLEVCGHVFIDGHWEVELNTPSGLNMSLKDWYRNYAGIII